MPERLPFDISAKPAIFKPYHENLSERRSALENAGDDWGTAADELALPWNTAQAWARLYCPCSGFCVQSVLLCDASACTRGWAHLYRTSGPTSSKNGHSDVVSPPSGAKL